LHKRANIPTEELRDFVADDEQAPKTMLYPRDPSLDPQLVWKGKDEQDAADLAVPVVPIYIQEKIHPQALVEDLRREQRAHAEAATAPRAEQLNLFADFNGVGEDFDRKVDFYSHDAGSQPHWSNRMILGDSLLVMTSLAEKEGLKGKVQMIYLDPPYGIKFGSNWQVSTRKRDVKDGKVEDATRQPEQVRAFRDTWKLGIHSYLAYLRDRLVVARELLTDTGSIFVQIGDENVHLVRAVMDEVFGSDNFVMAAKYPYYLLADSPEGIEKEAELTGQRPPAHPTELDVRKGFVDPRRRRVRPDHRRDPQLIRRRHRLLVHRHELRRRKLLRPARVLHWLGRAVRKAQARPPRRNRRGRLVGAVRDEEPAVR
jgi:hypothetical protein